MFRAFLIDYFFCYAFMRAMLLRDVMRHILMLSFRHAALCHFRLPQAALMRHQYAELYAAILAAAHGDAAASTRCCAPLCRCASIFDGHMRSGGVFDYAGAAPLFTHARAAIYAVCRRQPLDAPRRAGLS